MSVMTAARKRLGNTRVAPRRSSTRLGTFGRDQDGSLLLFGMMILILMLWAGGLAIDAIRVETTRTNLQNTIDRAVLAAADLNQSDDAQAVVADYFDKAGLSQYLGAVTVSSTRASGQLSFRRVSASASATINTMFMNMLGIDTLVAASSGTAEEGITDLEISLVLDVSGSMGWSSSSGNSKIYELRNAAKDFVYYMMCNPNETRTSGAACSVEYGKVSITLVPYNEQVVAGANLLGEMNVTSEHLYSNCVTFSANQFQSAAIDPNVALKRTGHFDPWSNYWNYASNNNRTCRLENWREIQPFMDDYQALEARIGNLSAGGYTSIDVGMKWGSALLDPGMQGTVTNLIAKNDGSGGTVVNPVFAGRPYSYTKDYSMKVIVLMTDGVNTTQHYLKDAYRDGLSPIYRNTAYTSRYSIYNANTGKYYYTYDGTWNDFPYGDADGQVATTTNTRCRWSWWYGYRCWTTTSTSTLNQPGSAVQMTYPEVWNKFSTKWFAGWSWLSDPVSTWGNATKNARLQDVCDATKAQGVIVYTIGFEVSGNADTVMSNCASTPGHYFAANGTNLSETFGTIASSINQLRLTQ